MATRTKAQFEALYGTSGTIFPDNIIGAISEGDLRDFGQDIADSVFTSGIISTKITVSSAEILALNSTPKTLVAAQGAGTVIEPISFTLFLDYNSVAYLTNLNVEFIINGVQIATTTSYNILSSTSDLVLTFVPSNTGFTNTSNSALLLRANTGNPTAGNSPLYAYVTYRVITL